MRYEKIDNQLFINNREKLAKKLLPGSMAIFNSNDQFPRNGDQHHKFRQNSDLFWVSGLDQEKTIVILFPDAPYEKYKEIAFVVKTNEQIAVWEGYKYTKEHAAEVSGIKTILWLEDFEMVFHELMNYAYNIYLNAIEYFKFKTDVPYRDFRFTEWIKKQYPNHNYKRLAPHLQELRMIKSEIEIELMKKAINITDKAFRRILKFTKPGVMEYEIQAEIDHEFTINRADDHAYHPIVASGKNALCLHYNENNSVCGNNELILFDFGAEYANYAADLSRTIPVNGKFSPRQKECYNAVLRVLKKAKQLMMPGICIDELNAKVNKIIEEEMITIGLFTRKDVENQDPEKPLYFKYFMHGNSHFMGMDVHDVGNKQIRFEEGMVLSCEPGLYITEENMGIRIENDILISKDGPIDLMENIPIEADEIERLMKK